MNWAAAYLKRPHGLTALLLLGVAFGFLSFQHLPLNLFPDANYPKVAVILVQPGASAEDMTDDISRRVERELATIDQVRMVRATIRDETAAVTVEFEYEKGLDAAVTDVNAALNRILPELPPDMQPPRLFRVSDATQPVQTLAVSPQIGAVLSLPKVRQLCDNKIKEALLRVDEIANVEIFGGYTPEIRLLVDADRLADLNLSVHQVVAAISAQNQNIPTGRLYREASEYLIKIKGEQNLRHRLGDIVIGQSGGAPVYLRDLARIQTTHEQRRSFYHGNGRPAIGINILRSENGHVTETLTALETALPKIRSAFPGLRFEVADTQEEIIKTSVSNLMASLQEAVILTVAVIFLMLARMRMTLLAAVSIPFTFLLTFSGMNLLNYELNIVTLTAIILAVGLLVDDAIVVIENIDRHAQREQKTPFQAAAHGTNEIFLADFAGTATTIAVLLPIMFVGGYSQKILRPLTVVLAIALLSSYIVSITIIPLLAQYLIKAQRPNRMEAVVERIRNIWLFPLQQMFVGAIRFGASRWGLLIFPLLIGLLLISLRQIPLAGRDLMPPMDTGIIKISFETWPNTAMGKTETVVSRMEAQIMSEPGFIRMSTAVGAEANVISFGAERTSQEGIITAHFKNRFERPESIWQIEADLRNAFADFPGLKTVHVYDYGATPLSAIAAPIDVMISGPDPAILDRLAEKVKNRLHSIQGLTSVSRTWDQTKREVSVQLDESRLTRYGLTVSDVSKTLKAATTGLSASRLRVPGEDGYDIRFRFDPHHMNSLGELSTVIIPGPNGPVALKEIAELLPVWRQTVITRQSLQPTADVIGYRATTAISYLQGQVNNTIAEMKLPAGYTLSQEGEIKQMKKSFGRLGTALALALLLLYFSLTITFRSFSHPLIIMSAIPLAFIGVPWGMLLLNRHFCMPAAMGMVLLSGIVVNNSILLIDFIEIERKNGRPMLEAVQNAIYRRTRPILMTAFSTMAGMLPIAMELAVGLERLSPLAVVAIAGLLAATGLTLAYVPVVYLAVESLKAGLQK